jgi:hypothetical protein
MNIFYVNYKNMLIFYVNNIIYNLDEDNFIIFLLKGLFLTFKVRPQNG